MDRLHSNVIRRFNWTMVYAIPSCYLLAYDEHGGAPIRPFEILIVVDTFVQYLRDPGSGLIKMP